jgi:hypothetical protein
MFILIYDRSFQYKITNIFFKGYIMSLIKLAKRGDFVAKIVSTASRGVTETPSTTLVSPETAHAYHKLRQLCKHIRPSNVVESSHEFKDIKNNALRDVFLNAQSPKTAVDSRNFIANTFRSFKRGNHGTH